MLHNENWELYFIYFIFILNSEFQYHFRYCSSILKKKTENLGVHRHTQTLYSPQLGLNLYLDRSVFICDSLKSCVSVCQHVGRHPWGLQTQQACFKFDSFFHFCSKANECYICNNWLIFESHSCSIIFVLFLVLGYLLPIYYCSKTTV